MNSKKRILITGGAGFIGSHLCRYYLDLNYEVICLDNLYTGKEYNIKELLKNPLFSFYKQDVIEQFFFPQIDIILNFACPASPPHYQKNPIRTFEINVFGMQNVLELARKNNSIVIQASTSEIYGDPLQHPQSEKYWGNTNPIGLRSCYDEGKRAAETLCFDYQRLYDIDVRVIRIFNTYGPYMASDDGRVVSNFICQALQNKDITIYGNGEQTRSFCYIDDLVKGITNYTALEESYFGPINLGNPHEFKVLELAEKVSSKINSKSKIIFHPLPSDDPRCRKPNIDRAKKILKWNPEIQLDFGLEKTIDYFSKILSK